MSRRATIDAITEDPANHEFVLYLVETGPWGVDLATRIANIHRRMRDALEIVFDGHLAQKYPNSKGSDIRIQIDLHDHPPRAMHEAICSFREALAVDPKYRSQRTNNSYVGDLRIVTGAEMGRGHAIE
jgi:hypothetical protein